MCTDAASIVTAGNRSDVIAVGNVGLAVIIGKNTGGAAFTGNGAGVIAAGDGGHGTVVKVATENTGGVVVTADSSFVAAACNAVAGTLGHCSDTGGMTFGIGCSNRALNDDIFDLGIFDKTKETGILGSNLQPGNGITLSVKDTGELVEILANGRKELAAQINIIGQFRIEFRNRGRIIDLVSQPCQLLAVFNLIGRGLRAVTGGLGLGFAVPRRGASQGDGNGCILGNGEGITYLGVARGFDRVGVFTVREEIAAVGFRADGLPVPENGDGGVDVRRGDIKGDRALFYGRESDGLADRAAVDGDLAVRCPIAEGGDSVVIFAVGESERPVAAGLRTGLSINGDLGELGIRGVNRESDGIGGDLPREDGVAVIDARRSDDECIAQRGGERLQFVGGFGRGVGVGAEGVEVVAVGDAAAAFFAYNRIAVAAVNFFGGVAVFDSGIAAVKICSDTTGAPATAGDCSAVVAVLNGNCAGHIGSDAGSIVACGRN